MIRGTAILSQHDGRLLLRTPFSEAFVEEIKRAIPRPLRGWSPGDKLWWVDLEYLDDAYAICKRHFSKVVVEGMGEQAPPPPQWSDRDNPYQLLLQGLPTEALKKIHRIAIASVHPDVGGDLELAKMVNAAWDRIRKARGIN